MNETGEIQTAEMRNWAHLLQTPLIAGESGVCRVCLCTEESPCLNWITRGPCVWANGDMTLCDSPVCIIIDFQRRILEWDV